MTESHPSPDPGWSTALWPRRLPERLRLDARLYRWPSLIYMLLGGLAGVVASIFGIYDALYGEPHRYTRFRNPVVELIIGPIGIVFFSVGCAYLIGVMALKRCSAVNRSPEFDYESLTRLLPMHNRERSPNGDDSKI